MRRTTKDSSEVESRPRWGVYDRPSKSPPRSSTLPRTTGKKSRAPAPPPPGKVGRSVALVAGMATFHHPRRKFHNPCKGRSVLLTDDDEVFIEDPLIDRNKSEKQKNATQIPNVQPNRPQWTSNNLALPLLMLVLLLFSSRSSSSLQHSFVFRFFFLTIYTYFHHVDFGSLPVQPVIPLFFIFNFPSFLFSAAAFLFCYLFFV